MLGVHHRVTESTANDDALPTSEPGVSHPPSAGVMSYQHLGTLEVHTGSQTYLKQKVTILHIEAIDRVVFGCINGGMKRYM
jgi:hypothetical protein